MPTKSTITTMTLSPDEAAAIAAIRRLPAARKGTRIRAMIDFANLVADGFAAGGYRPEQDKSV